MPATATKTVSRPESLELLVRAIKKAWRDGEEPDAAGALRDHPDLLQHRTFVIDLAYEEYCLREESGQAPELASFCGTIPAFQSYLRNVIWGHCQLAQFSDIATTEIAWPNAGDEFAGHRITRELGRGAFARVYLATDADTGDRPVVLKLSPTASPEARTLGPIQHPNVVGVHWARRIEDAFVICMPFVGSTTLRDVIVSAFEGNRDARPTADVVRGTIEPAQVPPDSPLGRARSHVQAIAAITASLADALAHLHRRGISHGDLKPSNIVLGPSGHPYLIDFNLAGGHADSLLRCGGTLPYMSPERVRLTLGDSSAVGDAQASDVYSFGAVLFEALTGRLPFPPIDSLDVGEMAADLARRQEQPAPPIRQANPDVPRPLANLIDACLARSPSARPAAEEVARALNRFAGPRSNWTRWFACGAVLVLTLAGAGLWLASRGPAANLEESGPSSQQPLGPFERGVEHLRAGNVQLALAAFDEAKRAAADGRTYAHLAYCYTRLGQPRVAAEYYEMAVDHGYRPAWVHNNRAYVLTQFNKTSRAQLRLALDEATKARELSPADRSIRFNWAHTRFLANLDPKTRRLDDPECVAEIRAVLASGPGDSDLYLKSALILAAAAAEDKGRLAESVECLRKAVESGCKPVQFGRDSLLRQRLGGRADFAEVLRLAPPERAKEALYLQVKSPVE
jgi:tetratricopeptide (TPR) repeat protein